MQKLWKVLNKTANLKALLLETSFPNNLQGLADISGTSGCLLAARPHPSRPFPLLRGASSTASALAPQG